MDELTLEKQHPPQIRRPWALLVLGRQLAEFEEEGGLRSKSGGREFDGLTWDEMPFADRRTLAAALRPRRRRGRCSPSGGRYLVKETGRVIPQPSDEP